MVWYGMVWYGMVWYGMVWYGMVWYMVWYGMVWYVNSLKTSKPSMFADDTNLTCIGQNSNEIEFSN